MGMIERNEIGKSHSALCLIEVLCPRVKFVGRLRLLGDDSGIASEIVDEFHITPIVVASF